MYSSPTPSDISDVIVSASVTLPQNKSSVKIYCLSDLHADTPGCLEWLKSNCIRREEDRVHTVFICAGDVSSDVKVLRDVFSHLKANYDDVCYTPGNHDLWRKGSVEHNTREGAQKATKSTLATCSFSKLLEVLRCAQSCQVHTGPLQLLPTVSSPSGSPPPPVKVIPLFSWYHSSWDTEPTLEHPDFLKAEQLLPFDKKWSDFRMCAWSPSLLSPHHSKQSELMKISSIANESTALAEYFSSLNEPFLPPLSQGDDILPSNKENTDPVVPPLPPAGGSDTRLHTDGKGKEEAVVVTYSHFLPRQELCPEKKYLFEPHMTKVIGSNFLEAQIRRVQPQLHIFGHTHIPIELTLEGIRYVQWPLGYAREKNSSTREVYGEGPLLVYDSSLASGEPVIRSPSDTIPPVPMTKIPGFPLQTQCSHSRWSEHYRQHNRTAAACKLNRPHGVYGVNDEETLSPWLATKLSDFLNAMGV